MGRQNNVRGILILLLTFYVKLTISLDDVPEFQYPCYVDICTFPSQFCNSRERRCSTCSREVCRLQDSSVPLACRYTCLRNKQITTVRPAETTILTSPQRQGTTHYEESLASLHLMMVYSAVITTLFLLVLISFIAVYAYRKMEKSAKYNRTTQRTVPKTTHSDHSIEDTERQRTMLTPKKENNLRNAEMNLNLNNDSQQQSYTITTISSDSTIEMQPMTSNDQTSAPGSTASTPGEQSMTITTIPVNATIDLNKNQHHKPWPQSATCSVQTATGSIDNTENSNTPLLHPVQNG